jgi:hypothetical protein
MTKACMERERNRLRDESRASQWFNRRANEARQKEYEAEAAKIRAAIKQAEEGSWDE